MNLKKHGNKVKLGKIADIISGLTVNRFLSSRPINYPNNEGNNKMDKAKEYQVLTQKSVTANNIDENHFESVTTDKIIEKKYFAQYKDIVIKKTSPYNAAVIQFDRNDVIIPSNFAIIRVKEEFIAIFLAYILNGNNVKHQLNKLVEGTNVHILKIANLNNLILKKRSKHRQVEFSKLFYLLNHRRTLLDKKRKLEETLKEDLISKL